MRVRTTEAIDPESCRALWGAVLEDAIHIVKRLGEPAGPKNDWSRNTTQDRVLASHWLRSASTDVGSFRWVCDVLDLNSGAVLEHIHRRRAA